MAHRFEVISNEQPSIAVEQVTFPFGPVDFSLFPANFFFQDGQVHITTPYGTFPQEHFSRPFTSLESVKAEFRKMLLPFHPTVIDAGFSPIIFEIPIESGESRFLPKESMYLFEPFDIASEQFLDLAGFSQRRDALTDYLEYNPALERKKPVAVNVLRNLHDHAAELYLFIDKIGAPLDMRRMSDLAIRDIGGENVTSIEGLVAEDIFPCVPIVDLPRNLLRASRAAAKIYDTIGMPDFTLNEAYVAFFTGIIPAFYDIGEKEGQFYHMLCSDETLELLERIADR